MIIIIIKEGIFIHGHLEDYEKAIADFTKCYRARSRRSI